jgi:hypothetical protein
MSIFSRSKKTAPVAPVKAECQHWELAPRWDNATDLGKQDLVTFYQCGCGLKLTPAEARALHKEA